MHEEAMCTKCHFFYRWALFFEAPHLLCKTDSPPPSRAGIPCLLAAAGVRISPCFFGTTAIPGHIAAVLLHVGAWLLKRAAPRRTLESPPRRIISGGRNGTHGPGRAIRRRCLHPHQGDLL